MSEAKLDKCRVCSKDSLEQFIDFGRMPVANAFLKEEDLDKPEYTYNMAVGLCGNCNMTQLIQVVPYDKYIVPGKDSKTNYAFFSSTSSVMEKHFAEMAQEIERRFLPGNSRVVEIGSNDGIMLQAFSDRQSVLGI